MPYSSDIADIEIDREHRIAMLLDVFDSLTAGRMPRPEAAAFVGSAGLSWLVDGGDLELDHLRVRAPRGSHRQPHLVAREMMSSSSMRADTADAAVQTSQQSINRG